MKLQNITIALTILVASIGLTAPASAQNFVPQTFDLNNYGGTHADAQRVLGAPAQHRGLQGLPMTDSVPRYNRPVGPMNDINIEWRGDSIFNPQQRQQRTSNYNYQPHQAQYNAAQLQSSIQNFQRALQQVRANRQNQQQFQQQRYWQQQQPYPAYHQPQYHWRRR